MSQTRPGKVEQRVPLLRWRIIDYCHSELLSSLRLRYTATLESKRKSDFSFFFHLLVTPTQIKAATMLNDIIRPVIMKAKVCVRYNHFKTRRNRIHTVA